MKYKLLSIDLDGTLLNRVGNISPSDLTVLKDFSDQGGKIILSTGRAYTATYKSIATIERFIKASLPYTINLCGACVTDSNKELIYERTIPNNIVKLIDKEAKKRKIKTWIYSVKNGNKSLVYCNNPILHLAAKVVKHLTLEKFSHDLDLSAYKINLFSSSSKNMKAFKQFLEKNYGDNIRVCLTHKRHIEVTLIGTDKGTALEFVANRLNIPLNEVAALGDSCNDLAAFMKVKFSATIKSKSKELTSNSSVEWPIKKNGVGSVIKKYILDDNNYKIKLIASDLDGTILTNAEKIVLPTVIDTISKFSHQLPYFCIATGRNVSDSLKIIESLNLAPMTKTFVIANSGSILFDADSFKVLDITTVGLDDANKFWNLIIKLNQTSEFGELGSLIHFFDQKETKRIVGSGFKNRQTLLVNNKEMCLKHILNAFPDFLKQNNENLLVEISAINPQLLITKFIIYFENICKRDSFIKFIKTQGLNFDYFLSADLILEIMPANINKGVALKKLCKHLNIENAELLTVGDQENDISMLKMTEWSFTFANSYKGVKDATRYVLESTPSNIVKEAIETYLNNGEHINE